MSRFWLVEVAEHLDELPNPTTRTGVFFGVKHVNGVERVTDLDAVSLETLEPLLRSDGLGVFATRSRRSRKHGVD